MSSLHSEVPTLLPWQRTRHSSVSQGAQPLGSNAAASKAVMPAW